MVAVDDYLYRIEASLRRGDATEHTHRPALKTLIESLISGITATNEPKAIDCGAPDYIVTRGAVPLGYIEAKDIGKSLARIEKDEQLKRYRDGLPNLILTDYLEFRWYVAGEHRLTARLAEADSSGKLTSVPGGHEKTAELLQLFLAADIPTIRSPRELASRMAGLASIIRDNIVRIFEAEEEKGSLHQQLEGFRQILIDGLTRDEFADMYAQTICYGLFAAACSHDWKDRFTREGAAYDLPGTNPLLRELFSQIAGPGLDYRLVWAVEDLVELMNRARIIDILRNFGQRTRRTDPVLHFYETFLAEYDPKLREKRGVYYTPEPVVSYIVRSVDHILKTDFGLADGLADTETVKLSGKDAGRTEAPKVLVLDPAVGTGTFLHGIVDHIREHEVAAGREGVWNAYVRRHLLPRLFGFEFMMSPYTVCHMKLALQLAEWGYDFRQNERLRVYLTNTLEEPHKTVELPFMAELFREATEAGHVKQDHPVMVILGNPPYSGHSANKGKWISGLLRGWDEITGEKTGNYFEVDGKPLGERNPKWLNDDYVKFIRFAQWRIERTGYGVLAFITNHGYLDNPTFRGMRQSLMETFDDIYILDLHGNANKKERAPDGSSDKNVFDIKQGVAIGIFVKKKGNGRKMAAVRHASLWGQREIYEGTGPDRQLVGGKYRWLWDSDITKSGWTNILPETPNYLFFPQNKKLALEYETGWKLTNAIGVNSVNVVTARDGLVIAFSIAELAQRFKLFLDPGLPISDAHRRYLAHRDKLDIASTRAIVGESELSSFIKTYSYRPFDNRYVFYSDTVIERSRHDVMKHMYNGENLSIVTCRQTVGAEWRHALASKNITDDCYISTATRERGYSFPLYLYPSEATDLFDNLENNSDALGGRRANFAPEFIEDFKTRLSMEFLSDGKGDRTATFGPEDIFNYIYAVLYSPAYRDRYVEFLKIDFPHVPLTSKTALFRDLCALGDQLVSLHLIKQEGVVLATFPARGTDEMEKVSYTAPSADTPGRVWINKTQYFEGISPNIWEFHIGGYRVAEKWLKDRKGRILDYDDIRHYQKTIAALAETIRLMTEIDEAIEAHGGWPME